MRTHNSTLVLLVLIAGLFVIATALQPVARVYSAQAEQQQQQAASEPHGFNSAEANFVTDVFVQPAETMDQRDAELALAQRAPQPGTDIQTLSGGLDHVAAGTGTRNAGYGTIRLRGVPPGATVVLAYLYWATIRTAPFGETARFRGNLVSGQLIGNSQQPCWNPSGVLAAFRANVTSYILPGINGDYSVTNLASNLTNGSDPWTNVNNTMPLAEGASLVVIYSHPSVPTTARYWIYHGPHYFAGTLNVTHTFTPAIPTHTALKHTRLGADGQTGFGIYPLAFATDERTFIGQTAGALTLIRGSGPGTRNFASDWNGFDGQPLNQLWDTNTDNITGTLPAGAGSYLVRYISRGDCIAVVAQILSAR